MYYPQSKILSNQSTSGQEYVHKKNIDVIYVGDYHILATGKIYTGKNPRDGQVEELIPIPSNDFRNDLVDLNPNGHLYKATRYDAIRTKQNIKPPNAELIEPRYSEPIVRYPSFNRYFLRRTNNVIFTEVNQVDFNAIKIKDPKYNFGIYIPFELIWTTSGANIAEINQKMTLLTEKRFKVYGLSQYIINYTEFSV
tara:strand:- start:217 stop:804 length:588 start_codon:yes stop_codon:yes gene_type:complete